MKLSSMFQLEFICCLSMKYRCRLRQKLNELTASKSKDKSSGITINDFVIKAAALACKKRPETNSIWMEKSIRQSVISLFSSFNLSEYQLDTKQWILI